MSTRSTASANSAAPAGQGQRRRSARGLSLAAAALVAVGLVAPAAGATDLIGIGLNRGTWNEVNPEAPWAARAGLQAVSLNGSFYVMGGRTPLDPSVVSFPGASQIWGDVWRSDDRGRSWRQVTAQAPWPARAYFQAVTLRGSMYVLGGQNFRFGGCPGGAPACSDFFSDVWRSRDGATWKQLTSGAGWTGRAGLSAVVHEGAIYVLGGSRNDDSAVVGGPPQREYFNDVWRSYDGVHWKQMTAAAPWEARAGAVVVSRGSWMYLLGGEKGFTCDSIPGQPTDPGSCEPPYFNDVWRSKDGAHWEQVTPSAGWSPRPGHQCVVMLGQFLCFGGFGLQGNPVDMWASWNGRDWRKLSSTPWGATSGDQIKYDFDALVVPGPCSLVPRLYTFGGDRETFDFTDPTNYLRVDNDVWRFTPRL
jgi:hypothetical protein